ncbi:hypothetical protein [Pedobacter sp. JY14-1]|uniref:DUF7935 family protein n=1 Tax=Pedobacter sp. JY14-1 TaxID=3034151 RepID=UPI0023E22A72|nr:hypothetical protein [Pedobacter sp. JY14-1]
MNLYSFAESVLKLAVPGVLILLAGYALIRNDLKKYLSLQEQRSKGSEVHWMNLRLLAHERLMVFVDRINPENLFIRLHRPGITLAELRALALQEIRSEFQHNIAQQLYVDQGVWDTVAGLKGDTLTLIKNVSAELDEEAEGLELGRGVLLRLSVLDHNPYELALKLIKQGLLPAKKR